MVTFLYIAGIVILVADTAAWGISVAGLLCIVLASVAAANKD